MYNEKGNLKQEVKDLALNEIKNGFGINDKSQSEQPLENLTAYSADEDFVKYFEQYKGKDVTWGDNKGKVLNVFVKKGTTLNQMQEGVWLSIQKEGERTPIERKVNYRDVNSFKIVETEQKTTQTIENLTAGENIKAKEKLQQPIDVTKTPTIEIGGKQRPTTNSNGNPIHATEEGIRNFYKWFGNSEVVDKQGRPLVVYHGTPTEFYKFAKEKQIAGYYGKGFYFTDIMEKTDHYKGKDGQVMEVYLSAKNILVINNETPQSVLNDLAGDAMYGSHDDMDIEQRSKYTFGYNTICNYTMTQKLSEKI